jgi:hypothetical protein
MVEGRHSYCHVCARRNLAARRCVDSPLGGWQVPETMNSRYREIFDRQPIAADEIPSLRDLWIVRHSIPHNGGFVTQPDARRLRTHTLAEKQVLIDLDFVQQATTFLRTIVGRLESAVGPSLLRKWFQDAATGVWAHDQIDYLRLNFLPHTCRVALRSCLRSLKRCTTLMQSNMHDAMMLFAVRRP